LNSGAVEASAHAARIHRDDLFVEALPAFAKQLRLEAAFPATGQIDGHLPVLPNHLLLPVAVSVVLRRFFRLLSRFVAKVMGQLSPQCTLNESLGQLRQQSVRAQEVLGFSQLANILSTTSSGSNAFRSRFFFVISNLIAHSDDPHTVSLTRSSVYVSIAYHPGEETYYVDSSGQFLFTAERGMFLVGGEKFEAIDPDYELSNALAIVDPPDETELKKLISQRFVSVEPEIARGNNNKGGIGA